MKRDKKIRQVQARNSIETFNFKLDELSVHNLKKTHELINRLLNMKVSHTVLLRRAVALYRLHFIAAMFEIMEADLTKEERLEATAQWCELERSRLREAANGEFPEIDIKTEEGGPVLWRVK